MVQILKGAKEQQNNEAIPRTALARLAVKNLAKAEATTLFWLVGSLVSIISHSLISRVHCTYIQVGFTKLISRKEKPLRYISEFFIYHE